MEWAVIGTLTAESLLGLVATVRRDGRAPQFRALARRAMPALKAECRRRGLVRECRAAKPRFPRAGG